MHTFRTPDFGVLGHADGDAPGAVEQQERDQRQAQQSNCNEQLHFNLKVANDLQAIEKHYSIF